MMPRTLGVSRLKELKCKYPKSFFYIKWDHPFLYQKFFSKDVRLPVQLQRAMAAEAEAAREARAKVKR